MSIVFPWFFPISKQQIHWSIPGCSFQIIQKVNGTLFFPSRYPRFFKFSPSKSPIIYQKSHGILSFSHPNPKRIPKINGKPYVFAVFLHIQLKKTSTDNPPKRSPRRITGALVKDRWLIQLQQLFAEMDASRIRKELITATEMAALIQAASTNGALVGKLGEEAHRKAGGKWRLI